MRPKAEMTIEELIKLVLAAAGIFLMIYVLYTILSPNYSYTDNSAEQYFHQFQKTIKEVKSKGTSNFKIWNPDRKNNFFIVYFSDKLSVEENGKVFLISEAPSNTICLCYLPEGEKIKGICRYCEDLNYPAKYNNKKTWTLSPYSNIRITFDKKTKTYIFAKETYNNEK